MSDNVGNLAIQADDLDEYNAREVILSVIANADLPGIDDMGEQIVWPDMQFESNPQKKHIRINVTHVSSSQLSFGSEHYSRKFRRTGVIIVQCLIPYNMGDVSDVAPSGQAIQLAMAVKNLFEGCTIRGVRFSDATIQEVPPFETEWAQVNAVITFQYDQQK